MFYIEEEKRGFNAEEDHAVPGTYQVEVDGKDAKEITFVASLEENIEEIDAKRVISNEIVRISSLMFDSGLIKDEKNIEEKELIRDFIVASDNFIV